MIAVLRNSAWSTIGELGKTTLFGGEVIGNLLRYGTPFRGLLLQMYVVGVRSITTTVFTGFFVGAIMAIQIHLQLRDFGAQAFLGGLSASVTLRNVGPLLIAFILSGKVGAYTTAELGTMQVTDQISAIRCLGMDPIRYLVAPRFLAVVVSSFLLLVIGLMTAIGGGALIAAVDLGVNTLNYVQNIPTIVTGWSVLTGVAKSFVFGVIIAAVSCYRGYTTRNGASGVGENVKSASVQTLVIIIIADFALSNWIGGLMDFCTGVLGW
jgi:phospholipid/cholesterol/gamma-HCH transport system permease protein